MTSVNSEVPFRTERANRTRHHPAECHCCADTQMSPLQESLTKSVDNATFTCQSLDENVNTRLHRMCLTFSVCSVRSHTYPLTNEFGIPTDLSMGKFLAPNIIT